MHITSWMCLVLLCLLSKETSAQVYVDLLNSGHNQNIKAKYKKNDNYYQQKTSWLNANIPFVLNEEGDLLMPSLQYNFTSLHHDFFEEDKLSFHNINLGLSWLNNWKSPHWASLLDVGIGVSSNLKTTIEDYRNYEITLLFFYAKEDELVWSFGVNYIRGVFGNYIVPLVGVDWMINDKTNLSVQTFGHLQLDYQVTPKIYAGFIAHSAPFSFSISDYHGAKDSYVHTYSYKFPYLPQSVGIYTDFYLKSEMVLFGKIGYEYSKTLYHESINGEPLLDSPYQGSIASGLAFEVGVAWRKRTARKFKYQ